MRWTDLPAPSSRSPFTVRRSARAVEIRCERTDLADGDAAAYLSVALRRAIRPGGPYVLVHLERVRRSDTKLVAVLVDAVRRSRECRTVIVIRPSPTVRRVFEMCRMDQLLAS